MAGSRFGKAVQVGNAGRPRPAGSSRCTRNSAHPAGVARPDAHPEPARAAQHGGPLRNRGGQHDPADPPGSRPLPL